MALVGRVGARTRRNTFYGLLFTSPALIGLLWFTSYPILASLYYSFTSFSAVKPPVWVGLDNYLRLFTEDQLFAASLYNTLYLVGIGLPLGIAFAFLLAMTLNMKVGGLALYRTVFYLPSITPPVGAAMLWLWLLDPQFGVVNSLLRLVGLPGPPWLGDPAWSKPALILMGLWGVGGTMIIFLAGLQDVPQEMYEAAQIDGAGPVGRFWNITVPFMSPYLLFTTITGLIGGFQYFAQLYVMTNGGPAGSTRTYAFYLYENAFVFFKMGYASAMAWILLVLVVSLTALIFRTSRSRVYYGGA